MWAVSCGKLPAYHPWPAGLTHARLLLFARTPPLILTAKKNSLAPSGLEMPVFLWGRALPPRYGVYAHLSLPTSPGKSALPTQTRHEHTSLRTFPQSHLDSFWNRLRTFLIALTCFLNSTSVAAEVVAPLGVPPRALLSRPPAVTVPTSHGAAGSEAEATPHSGPGSAPGTAPRSQPHSPTPLQ